MSEARVAAPVPVLSDFAGQGALYDGMIRTLKDGTFVHAYLISGSQGMGKRTLARLMAQYLLCTGENKPCGVCPACRQVLDANHPDVLTVAPGKPLSPDVKAGLQGIPVDEIRHVISLAGQHTFTGGDRVIIIERADTMNPPAQNALLKTLEEPIAGTVFLLLTDSPELLLPTIVSRCRAMKLHPWPDDVVLRALKAHGVAPDMAQKALSVCGGSIGQALRLLEKGLPKYAKLAADFVDSLGASPLRIMEVCLAASALTRSEYGDFYTECTRKLTEAALREPQYARYYVAVYEYIQQQKDKLTDNNGSVFALSSQLAAFCGTINRSK